MPVLEQGGFMNIVAHADDDLLFMNPDIAHGISDGLTNTTIYVTAGDAGYDAWYWEERETGAKAAYSVMAGANDWIDETLTVSYGTTSIDVHSSYLSSAPQVRLYFLRLPDGAGAIPDPADYASLARLEDGTRELVSTVDGETSYSRDGLLDVLSGIITQHTPEEFRLQVSEGTYSTGEHTDHLAATEFALEAIAESGDPAATVSHYVNYQSDQLTPNLSPEDAALSLEIMEAYSAHDVGILDEDGNMFPIYLDWTERQYIADSYLVQDMGSPPVDDPPPPVEDPIIVDPIVDDPTVDDPPPTAENVVYSLSDDPDSFLFDVDPMTGEITPKDWFSPSLDDAWDSDEDYIYTVTRIATPTDGSPAISEMFSFDTVAEGVLAPLGSTDPIIEEPADPPPPDDPSPPPAVDDPIVPVNPPPEVNGGTYTLSGADEFLFQINYQTGEISTKDWFIPSFDDAWDQDENHIYELTRTGFDANRTMISRQFLEYQVTPDDALTLISSVDDILLELASDAGIDDPLAMADLDGDPELEDIEA